VSDAGVGGRSDVGAASEVLGLVLGEALITYQQLGVATGDGVTLAGGDRRDRTTPPAGWAHPGRRPDVHGRKP
jgi:hypothetical protein